MAAPLPNSYITEVRLHSCSLQCKTAKAKSTAKVKKHNRNCYLTSAVGSNQQLGHSSSTTAQIVGRQLSIKVSAIELFDYSEHLISKSVSRKIMFCFSIVVTVLSMGVPSLYTWKKQTGQVKKKFKTAQHSPDHIDAKSSETGKFV